MSEGHEMGEEAEGFDGEDDELDAGCRGEGRA